MIPEEHAPLSHTQSYIHLYWTFIKIKTFVFQRAQQVKTPFTEWEKIFTNDVSDKGLVS